MQSKNAKRPKRKGSRVISGALCSILLVCAIAGAAFVAPVPVFALSAGGIKGTIASIVLSLLLQTGTAPTNMEWLNQLNAAYGVESSIGTIEQCITDGLLTETAEGLIDTGLSAAIEAAPEYTSLGLSDLFTTTAADAGVTAASGGVNLATTAINVGTAGTIGAFAGAAAVGVGVGVLINKAYNFLNRWIAAGMPINYGQPPAAARPEGYENLAYVNYKHFGVKSQHFDLYNNNTRAIGWADSKYNFGYFLYTLDKSVFPMYSYRSSDNSWSRHTVNNPYEYHSNTSDLRDELDYMIPFPQMTRSDALSYIQSVHDGTEAIPDLKEPISPDIITPLGNAQMIAGPDGADIINGQGNIVPEGYDMTPVDVDDYLTFADNANNNTDDGNTGQDIQGEAFNDFVDPYLVDPDQVPDKPIIPENPDNTVPEQPDRPITPDQPTFPDKPDATPEEIQDMGDLTTTPDLRSVFPFCIPWDIYNIFLIFDTGENRKAPHIDFIFPGTDWHIDVDLAQFDPAAALLRLLELILFIVGLAVATRSLIGANG